MSRAASARLARGFAVISHDSVHKGAMFDACSIGDQHAALGFAEASVPHR